MSDRPLSILLVEDDDVDIIKVKRAFEKKSIVYPLLIAENGIDALKMLRQHSSQKSLPTLVLLDLNMPRMNGIEFLRELRADPTLRQLIVVVLTTSKDERDVVSAFGMNVAGYIVKPVVFQEFVEALGTLDQYWTLSELP